MNKLSVASFTNLGYVAHSRGFAEYEPCVADKTIVVTGATGGIGKAAALALSAMGARIVAVGRSRDKLADLAAELSSPFETLQFDLSLMSRVRKLASVLEKEDVDVLINNVGVLLPEYTETVEGLEKSSATNLLGHFLLTNHLLPGMAGRGSGRIINVSSGGMYGAKLKPRWLLPPKQRYNGTAAYAQAKRAQVVLTEIWSEQVSSHGVTVNSMHPGWVATPGVKSSLPTFNRLMKPLLRTPNQGADTIVWLAGSPDVGTKSGRFWFDRREVPTHMSDETKESTEVRDEMWALLSETTGIKLSLEYLDTD